MARDVTWLGSKTCDICNKQITDILYDSATKQGPWATMCETCYCIHGVKKLGMGFGQKYQMKEDGQFHKVEG